MFVRTLIGQAAGTIIDQPYDAATANVAAGTAKWVTDVEVAEAGLAETQGVMVAAHPEAAPRGYRIEPNLEGGGFDLLDAGGVRLNQEPFPNAAAARSAAHEHVAETIMPVVPVPAPSRGQVAMEETVDTSNIPPDWRSLHHSTKRKLARQITGSEPANTEEAEATIAAFVDLQKSGA